MERCEIALLVLTVVCVAMAFAARWGMNLLQSRVEWPIPQSASGKAPRQTLTVPVRWTRV